MALEVPIDACSKNSWEPPTQSPRRMAVTLPKPNFQGMCLRKWMECNVGCFQHSQDPVSKCFTMSWMRQKCILFKGYRYPFTVANFAMPMAPRWDMQTLMTWRPFKGRKFDQGLWIDFDVGEKSERWFTILNLHIFLKSWRWSCLMFCLTFSPDNKGNEKIQTQLFMVYVCLCSMNQLLSSSTTLGFPKKRGTITPL